MKGSNMFILVEFIILSLLISLTVGRLDVTFFVLRASPSISGNVYIGGYSAGDTISTVGTSFTYGRILDTGTGPNLPLQRYENFRGYGRRLHLSSGVDRPGVYYCDANANTGETERLQTVLVAGEAEVKPQTQTTTVSWGDDVTLTMTTSIPEASLKWRHNGIQKPEWNGRSSITISFAKTSDAGIYECYSNETQRSQGKHGFMRLIVRGCPNGKWGPHECFSSCPTCYNGGICNSDTGECICAIGFRGNNCEIGCGRNSWGMTCGTRCSSRNSDECRSSFFCIADPYGCSCSASYGGLNCSTECPDGKYGAGCTQTCHCVNGCDRATGACNDGGCLQGWSGSNCHIPDSCNDGFYGELCEYKCHCKDNAACGKTTGECSNGQCAPGWVNVNITDCQQDGSPTIWSLYNIKVNPGEQGSIVCTFSANPVLSPDDVTLVDQSGSPVTRPSHYVPGIYLSTSNFSRVPVDDGLTYTCRVGDHSKELTISISDLYALPRFSESNAPVVTVGTFHATVTWQKWEEGIDFGDGPVEAYSVYFIKTRASGDWNLHRKFPVTDQDQTVYSTDITGLDWSATYNFTVTVKRPGSKGEGSKETITKATTQCAEPTQGPTMKSVISTDPTKIVVEFEVPDPYAIRCDSGFIRSFHVKFRKANQPDGYTEREVEDGSARSLTVDGLMAYTEYEIMLAFWNRNYLSPWSSPFSITTAESVPTKPRNVTLWPAVYAMEVSWSIPDPANGVVLKYTIAYWRTGEASTRQEEEFTENLRDVNTHVISNLTFRVLYSVQVQAFTSKGPGSYSDVVSAETIETVPRIPSDLAVRDVTDTSMELSWSPPYPFSGAIIKYGVWYEATRSVFKDTLMKSVTLLLEGTDNSLSMEDLSPGTLYKIGVNASTAKGFGDRATALIWTEFSIDISEVLPRKEANTKFVVKNDNSVEVTLLHPHKDSKISEDTTLIEYIIVLDHDKVTDTRRKRSIDTLQLGEYSDTGPTYYITASLPLQDLPETFIIGDGTVYGGYTNVPLTTGGQYDVYYGLKSNISTELMYHLDDIPALSFTARLPTPKTRSSPTGAIVGGILTVVFIVCAVIVAVFIVRRRRLRQDHESPQQDEVELNKKSKRTKENQVYSNEQVTMEKMADVNPKAQDENSGDTNEYQIINIQSQKVIKEETGPGKQAEKTSEEGFYTDTLDEPKDEYTSLSISSVSMELMAVPVADFKKLFTDAVKKDKQTLKSRLEREWQKLNEVSYKPKSGECRRGRLPQNLNKNRFPDILPIDRYRPQLSTPVEDPNATDYINASFLDGYVVKNAYLATQMPLPHTVVDFWRMVYDHKVRTIIMLNDEDCDKSIRSKYWPDDEHSKYIGPFEVKLNKVKQNGLTTERAMTVSMGKESVSVLQFQIREWSATSEGGKLTRTIADLIEMVEKRQKKTGAGSIVVHCINGNGRSGVYCSASFACERIKVDQTVDVFEAVKSLRNKRTNVVENLEQYMLCYEIVRQYCDVHLLFYENTKP